MASTEPPTETTDPAAPSADAGPTLRIFGAPVPGLADDLLALAAFHAEAKGDLWALIGPNLSENVGDFAERAAEQFGVRHDLPLEQLIPLVRGCRRLFRRAAAMDLPVEVVHQDVLSLCEDREIARRLAACYTKALTTIRTEAVLNSMQRFGPELVDIGVRIDHVATSRHHANKMIPIAMLSFRYRDGGENRTLTLQAAPPVLKRLHSILGGMFK